MPRRKKEDEITKKLEYLGLNLNNIPAELKQFEPLNYKPKRILNKKKYIQYRYVPIENISILISPTNRLDELKDKYKKARPLAEYLDDENEENFLKYTTFLNMLKEVNIEEIEEIEEEQTKLQGKIPFKVKYQRNYLWQIYYAENTEKYFMIVTTEDTDYSAFFYLLKKKIEKNRKNKIFVPISNVQYSNKYLSRNEISDIENYLWMFTKDLPSIYEVYNQNDELSIQIVGETNVYDRITTNYKIKLENEKQSSSFYKLLKALFILQSELTHYYKFDTKINDEGELKFYYDGTEVKYEKLSQFIREQYRSGIKRKREVKISIRKYTKRLEQLKQKEALQEIEYLAKEKQISTFLECKKSFFGKVKYFFKYNKKDKKNNNKNLKQEINDDNEEQKIIETEEIQVKKEKKRIPIKKIYTLDELLANYKELEKLETDMKNLVMDVNAIKLKSRNMQKKIENATKFIEEIDSHKKSIFEFWKYSNKDEMATLPEGEEEEVNVIRKIEKTFNYEDDFEKFGEKLDQIQRKNLNKNELDSIFIATTGILEILNKIKINRITPAELEKNLIKIKEIEKEQKDLDDEEYDIFGQVIEDSRKIKKINDKKHRELQRDEFKILDINQDTKRIGYRLSLEQTIKTIIRAIKKVTIPENLGIYKATTLEKLNEKEINVFNINPRNEIEEALKKETNIINIYKINVKQGMRGIGFTNIVFYDNINKTLPVGMNLSTKMIFDISKLQLQLKSKQSFKIVDFENPEDDFADFTIKDINVFEYDIDDSL